MWRQSIREQGGQPSCQQVDELLDERLGHLPEPSKTETVCEQTSVVTPPGLKDVAPRGRKSALRRFGPLALLPLSLLAVGASFVTMFGSLNQQSAEPVDDVPPPASSAPNPPAPQAQAPPLDVADRVFIDVLKKDGVPVPSHEYVTTQGRAVCGFLARQPDFAEAVRGSSKVLAIRGRIFPSTLSNIHLVATLVNGKRIQGETSISRSKIPIRSIELSPRGARPLPKAIEAIQQADLILMGPGSLYTSVIPNLLIPEIAQAIVRSRAPRVYIANLMTQPGETTHYTLSQHLRAIENHVGKRIINYVVANRKLVSPGFARRYRSEGAEPVVIDRLNVAKMKVRLLADNLLEEHGVIRHNSPRLASLLVKEFLRS